MAWHITNPVQVLSTHNYEYWRSWMAFDKKVGYSEIWIISWLHESFPCAMKNDAWRKRYSKHKMSCLPSFQTKLGTEEYIPLLNSLILSCDILCDIDSVILNIEDHIVPSCTPVWRLVVDGVDVDSVYKTIKAQFLEKGVGVGGDDILPNCLADQGLNVSRPLPRWGTEEGVCEVRTVLIIDGHFCDVPLSTPPQSDPTPSTFCSSDRLVLWCGTWRSSAGPGSVGRWWPSQKNTLVRKYLYMSAPKKPFQLHPKHSSSLVLRLAVADFQCCEAVSFTDKLLCPSMTFQPVPLMASRRNCSCIDYQTMSPFSLPLLCNGRLWTHQTVKLSAHTPSPDY